MYSRIFAACVVASGLTWANFAAAQESQTDKPGRKPSAGNQSQSDMEKRVDAQIEKLSKQVDLSSDQREQLRTQLTKGNQKTQQLWQQFADAHVQVIRQEAEMRAALEDTMEPTQKQQAQQSRQAKASARSHQLALDASKKQSTAKQSVVDSSDKKSKGNKSKSTTTDSQLNQSGDKEKTNEQSQAANNPDDQRQTEEYVWTMLIVPAQVELESLGLTAEQQQQCDQVCRNYHQQLVDGWQKINQLHDKLVATEAQKILDAENILTADQRAKLKNYRQTRKPTDNSDNSDSKS